MPVILHILAIIILFDYNRYFAAIINIFPLENNEVFLVNR